MDTDKTHQSHICTQAHYICTAQHAARRALLTNRSTLCGLQTLAFYQWWIPPHLPTLTAVQPTAPSSTICPPQPRSWAVWEWVAGVCKCWCRYVTGTNLQSPGTLLGVQPEYHTAEKTISAANTPAQMRNVLILAAALWLLLWQWWRKCQLFPPLNATLCLSLFLFIDLCLCLWINKVHQTVACLRMHVFPPWSFQIYRIVNFYIVCLIISAIEAQLVWKKINKNINTNTFVTQHRQLKVYFYIRFFTINVSFVSICTILAKLYIFSHFITTQLQTSRYFIWILCDRLTQK